jgi:hypothetical protein
VKRFNVLKKIGLGIIAILFIIILWPFQSTSDEIRTRRFCAYKTVYVEFEHDGKIWGTTFLNSNGKPATCDEDDVTPEPTTNLEKNIT